MKKLVELERPALWRPIRNKDLSIRRYAGGYPYMKKGIYGQSSLLEPVVRYAKNYKKYGKEFSVVFFSKETDITKAEGFMQKIAKGATREDIQKAITNASMSNMEYTSEYYEGK